MLKSEHGRLECDDRIIANGERQDKLDELIEASYKASHRVSLQQQVRGKTMKGDEDNQ